MEHYQRLGGSVDPSDEGLAFLFEQFIPASLSGNHSPIFKIYFRETPETHAAIAISIYIRMYSETIRG